MPILTTNIGYYAHHKRPVDKFFDKLRVLVDVHGMEYREAFRQCVKERMFDERVNEVERAVAEHQVPGTVPLPAHPAAYSPLCRPSTCMECKIKPTSQSVCTKWPR